jgi:hypothetical protein
MNEVIPGVCAGVVSTFVCNPLDMLRINYQTGNKITLRGNLTRGLGVGLLTVPSFWGIYFPMYSKLRDQMPSPIAAYMSCCTSSIFTSPLWYIRQKIQIGGKICLKEPIGSYYTGVIPTLFINATFIIQIPLIEYLRDKYENTIKNTFFITSFSKTIASSVFYPIDTLRSLKRKDPCLEYTNITRSLSFLDYYRGFHVYILRSIPYHTTVFCVYYYVKDYLKKSRYDNP